MTQMIKEERRPAPMAGPRRTDRSLYSAFERQVARHPDHTAVVDAHGSYSYMQLSQRAQALALSLCEHGASKNTPIAVLCEKSVHQVVSVLGVLGAGAAYLPLGPDWPVGRLEEILERASVRIVVASRAQLARLESTGLSAQYYVVVVDEPRPTPSITQPLPSIDSKDIAYVIFTSGSTGKPKGAVISHEGAMTTIEAVNERFRVTSQDSVLAVSRLSFDLSVYDIFGMLHAGGTIVFPHAQRELDPSHWQDLIRLHNVTVWNTVPQLMQLLVDSLGPDSPVLDSLRCVLLSGDWIPLSLPGRVSAVAPDATVVSLGGATEGSIWSIWYVVDRVEKQWRSIPYGFAMPDQQIHVLDDDGAPCAVGVTGNIYIGGKGVALGYWDDSEQTARSFEHHPALGRLFKTGDLGCLTARGYVEFQGRRDHQIKLNGYRIELEEISAKLLLCPGIRQAAVLVKQPTVGAAHLAAYYVATQPLRAAEIQAVLLHHLPEYMVPRSYYPMDELPLTANGKLDRNALLAATLGTEQEPYIPPRTDLEKKLCRLWAQSLGVERLGIKDDFFRWGGDSLCAIELACAMSRELGKLVTPHSVLAHPSVAELSSALAMEDDEDEVLRVDDSDAPLSFQQESALAVELRRPRTSAFPMAFEVLGASLVPHLKKSLASVVRRQAALRTQCERDERGHWRQFVRAQELVVEECSATEAQLERIYGGAYHASFDLTSDLPIRATIYRTKTSIYLLVTVHPIAFDGWSIGGFVDELSAALTAYTAGEEPVEPSGGEIRYIDYAHWQRRRMSGARLDRMLEFWRGALEGYQPFTLGDPSARPPSGDTSPDPNTGSHAVDTLGELVEFRLDPATSKKLRQLAREHRTTLFAVLLTALYVLLYRRTKQRDLAIASIVANRNRPQVQPLIGNFSNTRACRFVVDGSFSASTLISRVHEMLMESAEHSEVPFAQVMDQVIPGEDPRDLLPVRLNVHDFRSHLSSVAIQKFLRVQPLHQYFDIATYDVELIVNPGQESISGHVVYATSKYDRGFAEILRDQYASILKGFTVHGDATVDEVLHLSLVHAESA
jgi:amino acid adenylation domain-containing protein